jgi:hypothetical protein
MVIISSLKSALIGLLASEAFDDVNAFVQPRAFANSGIVRRSFPIDAVDAATSTSPILNMLPDALSTATSIMISDEAGAIAEANSGLQGMRTFFAIITVLVVGLAGLTYATAAFIVPKAAERLEKDTKRLRPGLWEEYEAKLGEGATMANRPDLLEELGNIMQPIIIADFEQSAEGQNVEKSTVSIKDANKKKGKGVEDDKVDKQKNRGSKGGDDEKKDKKKDKKKKDKKKKDKTYIVGDLVDNVDDLSIGSEEVGNDDGAMSECL